MKRILITGSSGFVGKYLKGILKSMGYYCIGIDKIVDLDDLDEFYLHDLTTPFHIEISFDICIHLASAVWWIIFNIEHADIITYNNLINHNTVNIFHKSHGKQFLFFSTINVFETNSTFLHEKLWSIDQATWYAISKAISEKFFEGIVENLVVIRPTNIFGKNQIKSHEKVWESHVIPDLLHKISLADKNIEVFGDWSQIRNFVHVIDLCKFLVNIFWLKWKHYFNLRSEILITIWELSKELIEFAWKNLDIVYNTDYMKYEKFKIHNFDMSYPMRFGFINKFSSIVEWLQI